MNLVSLFVFAFVMAAASFGNSVVGREVEHTAVIEVASKLQCEGLARLDTDPESALVALRQAFALELKFGVIDDSLCRACSSLCRALARVPSGLVEAVAPLIQAIDTVEARGEAGAHEHRNFLARELHGLARRLGDAAGPTGRLDELRAADRAYERLAQLAQGHGLVLGNEAAELVLTQQEIYFQLANTVQHIGTTLMRSGGTRDQEAACFYFQRALRKLRLAGLSEREPRMTEVRHLIKTAEDQLRAARVPPPKAPGAVPTTAGSSSADVEACTIQ